MRESGATSAWNQNSADYSQFHFKTEKNDLNKKTDLKMPEQIEIIKNQSFMNKPHPRVENGTKWIA